MPERLDRLRHVIDELEAELANVDSLDESTRARLEATRREIQDKLERDAPDPDSWRPDSLINRLTAIEQDFEQSHPTLSGLTRRLIDALGQMGI